MGDCKTCDLSVAANIVLGRGKFGNFGNQVRISRVVFGKKSPNLSNGVIRWLTSSTCVHRFSCSQKQLNQGQHNNKIRNNNYASHTGFQTHTLTFHKCHNKISVNTAEFLVAKRKKSDASFCIMHAIC